MGMYDFIVCKKPLPLAMEVDHRGHVFQTKSMFCDLDSLEIREDGTLWRQNYDTEDRSDPNAEGMQRLVGMAARVNPRWEHLSGHTGEIVFYSFASEIGQDAPKSHPSGWAEFSAYFVRGEPKHLELLCFEEPVAGEAT